jgi:hypothetical protein
MNVLNDPGSWQHFIKRSDNKGLSIDQIRSKYLTESITYNEFIIGNASQAFASSAVGGGSVPSTTPVSDIIGGGTGAITFDGVSQYFTATNSDVVNWLPGTGNFTIEWFMKKGVGGSSFPRVFSLGYNTGATIGCSIEGGTCYIWPYGGSLNGSMPAGYNDGSSWTHIAISRSGTTTKLFIDGVLKKTKTGDNRDITDSINAGADLQIGVDDPEAGTPNWWAGSLTNFRWDNSAIYTGSSLTVPTSPLEATATTKLLMLGGGASNPVYDATQTNTLINNGAQWTANTPF